MAEDLYLERMENNTYAARKERGQPVHGTTSTWLMILACLSWVMHFAACLIPEWRVDHMGVFGYGHRRSWGLFSVHGVTKMWWQDVQTNTCRYWGQMRVFNSCQSPICQWYQVKCRAYTDMWYVSSIIAVFFFWGLFIHAACIYMTSRMTPRMLKWAAYWWTLAIIFHAAGWIAHWLIFEDLFGRLEALSWYPDPQPGSSLILSGMALFFECIVIFFAWQMHFFWPDVLEDALDSESETDSDASSTATPTKPTKKKQKKKGKKKGKDDSSSSSDSDDGPPSKQQQQQQQQQYPHGAAAADAYPQGAGQYDSAAGASPQGAGGASMAAPMAAAHWHHQAQQHQQPTPQS